MRKTAVCMILFAGLFDLEAQAAQRVKTDSHQAPVVHQARDTGKVSSTKKTGRAEGKNMGGPMADASGGQTLYMEKGLPDYGDYYLRPIIGGSNSQGIHDRNAVDLAHFCGQLVMAAAQGVVRRVGGVGWNGGYGTYVLIDHPNGTETMYAHLSKTRVRAGDAVNQWTVIGKVGSTGHSTGCHLHFEVRGAKNPF